MLVDLDMVFVAAKETTTKKMKAPREEMMEVPPRCRFVNLRTGSMLNIHLPPVEGMATYSPVLRGSGAQL